RPRRGRGDLPDEFRTRARPGRPDAGSDLRSPWPGDASAPHADRTMASPSSGATSTMTQVADLVDWIEGFAPSRLAEEWDNVGLLWGDSLAPVARIMTCLTVTPATADEAIVGGAELIVSHHPILFRAV